MWMKIGKHDVNFSLGLNSSVVWLDATTSLPTTLDGLAGLALAADRLPLARSLERLHKLTTQEPQRPLSELRQAERQAKPEECPAREARPGRRPVARRRPASPL